MIPQAIGFFGWKRPEIAKKTLDAISRCSGVENWPLVAFLDQGAAPEIIEAIRGWEASTLLDCRVSDSKLGCSGNLTGGIMELFALCSSRFIVLEDDCYPAEDFITYMDGYLSSEHEANHSIMSVTSYRPAWNRARFGTNIPEYDTTPGFHCWGWGTWKSRMGHFHNALIPVRGDMPDDSWDTRLNNYAGHHGMVCLMPRLCRTLNIGTYDWTHTPGEDLTKEEWAGKQDPKEIRK